MTFSLEEFFQRAPATQRIHFLGICGIAMGQMALALQQAGYQVSGSDEQNDPPIAQLLAAAQIPLISPDRVAAEAGLIDLLVAGRAISPENPLIAVFAHRHVPQVSYPDLIVHFTRAAKQRLVVAGTKGKTTTTALLAWIADRAGLRPTFLIGGVPGNFPTGLRLTDSSLAILEGDEYASSPTDLTPKFVHYRPTAVVLTNIYPDHVELYPHFPDYRALFGKLLTHLPSGGFVTACGDAAAGAREILAKSAVPVTTVGWEETSDFALSSYLSEENGSRFHFMGADFHLPAIGKASALDAALATAAAHQLGIHPTFAAEALLDFRPVKERLEQVGTPGGVRLFLDSNAHPAALRLAVEALRERHPAGHLLCVVQPQTPGSRAGYVQQHLARALASATHVLLTPPASQIDDGEVPFSSELLLEELTAQSIAAAYRDTRRGIVSWIAERCRVGDTILLAVHPPSRALLVREISRALES